MIAVQLKMARVALGLTVRQTAEASGVSHDTITRIEAGQELKASTVAKVQRTLEAAGVEFIVENGGGPGVRLRKADKGAKELTEDIRVLKDRVADMPVHTRASPEAGMDKMRKAVAQNDLTKLKNRRTRMKHREDPEGAN